MKAMVLMLVPLRDRGNRAGLLSAGSAGTWLPTAHVPGPTQTQTPAVSGWVSQLASLQHNVRQKPERGRCRGVAAVAPAALPH